MRMRFMYVLLVLTALILSCGAGKGQSRLFLKNQSYHFETLRSLGYSTTGGADINEVLQTIGNITPGDSESWYENWMDLAERSLTRSEVLDRDPLGSGRALLRASNYFRTAEFYIPGSDYRKLECYRRGTAAFYRGLQRLNISHERGEVFWEEQTLDTLFFPGEGERSDTLILVINGYDSIKEETYFTLGSEALQRGYSFMSYDGPGQGSAIRERGLAMTPHWAPVNRAVLDKVLGEHPGIRRIVLVGFSLGSVLATKAAADDQRVDYLVHFDVFHDFSEAVGGDMPEFFKKKVFSEQGPHKMVERNLRLSMKFDSGINWALNHGAWVMGTGNSVGEAMNRYRFYEISADAPRVGCLVLLFAGETDHFVPMEMAEKSRLSFTGSEEVTLITYDALTGGGEHCQVGAGTLWTSDLFQWLEENR